MLKILFLCQVGFQFLQLALIEHAEDRRKKLICQVVHFGELSFCQKLHKTWQFCKKNFWLDVT